MARAEGAAGQKPPRAALAAAPAAPAPYDLVEGVAVVALEGVMLAEEPGEWWCGGAYCVTPEVERAFRAAVADEAARAVVLAVDSPGGEISGVSALADAVFAARSQKPVFAVVGDCCASAAYWVASQAHALTAGPTAQVGSIGVYTYFHDASRLLKNFGMEVDVFASGPLKAAGIPGTALSPAQKKSLQAGVDGLAGLFADAVARGRATERAAVDEWATGGVWLAGEAQKMGLIDEVAQPAQALAEVVASLKE